MVLDPLCSMVSRRPGRVVAAWIVVAVAVGFMAPNLTRLAAEGQAFYTTAADHTNCPIGAFTHGVELSPAKAQELQGLIGTMISSAGTRFLRCFPIHHWDRKTPMP